MSDRDPYQLRPRIHHKNLVKPQPYGQRQRKKKTMVDVVVHIKVDIRVWRTAMKLANGDRTRLVVRSPTEVSVLNPQFSKKRK